MRRGTRREIEETELRAAVHASPDDDAPRLVYADWLLERDDARGEFIQLQCARGTTIDARGRLPRTRAAGSRTRSNRLAEREQTLLRAHQHTWIAPVRAHVNSWFWHRGFVSRVDANLEKFISFATKIFEFTPLVSFYAMGCTPALVRKLATLPQLGALRSLTFTMQRIGATEAEIFQSPRFGKLRELTLQQNPLGDEAVAVLARSTTLSELRVLDLSFSDQRLTSRGLETLAAAEFFPRLTHLTLDCSLADKTAIRPLMSRGANLQVLSLGKQKLTKQEVTELTSRGLS